MAEISRPTLKEPPEATPRASAMVQDYLLEHVEIYRELHQLQKRGWESSAADAYFQKLQHAADTADLQDRKRFFNFMYKLGGELNTATSALTIDPFFLCNRRPAILDVCMAPGGFASAALNCNRNALLRGMSLPFSQGGHEMLIRRWKTDKRIEVLFQDVTMLSAEMGVPRSEIPANHPDAERFSDARPFWGQEFDLVLCDGQVLRTHPREAYRDAAVGREAVRLGTTQLVLGLHRASPGGTMVVLLHKADSWRTLALLHAFSTFSDVQIYKPRRGHCKRSSFYLVAKNLRPNCDAARDAVGKWKSMWKAATFGGVDGGDAEALFEPSDSEVQNVLDEFGPKLVRMVQPVFAVQAEALRSASFMEN